MTNYSVVTSSKILHNQVASLLLYQSVLKDEVGRSFLYLLQTLNSNKSDPKTQPFTSINCLQAYGNWFKSLAALNKSWGDYLIAQILHDDNPFSRQVQTVSLENLPRSLIAAAKHDLKILQNLSRCSPQQISQWVKTATQVSVTPIAWDLESISKSFFHWHENWEDALEELAIYYQKNGTGILAKYKALRWQEGKMLGIAHPDPIELREIVGYESQKEALLKNTEFLLAGYPALHVLLYGSRGSGKSSLVKGLLNQYSSQGLRLIEVSKSELKDLPVILEKLRDFPQKFIIFVDDLSFEEDDDAFKALKVVLEGSLTAKAQNVVVYATSNRRHLVREFFSDRPRPSDGDEVHSWDTLQEKLSFSDRFGLTLTFEPANQNTYLEIVRHLAQLANIPLDKDELEFCAKQWATHHNGCSGRTARQLIDFLRGELAINSKQ
ncbi:putative ATPase (AAA+ superfamily) [Pleurocapsa sp. PCC 7327]|uniref:ATP-binding protein n=1 Tax=Pleurocapsa sp. PCC 7327 TaxID=118163 RepID=UPI00029FDF51|nr:ATP-binding protein [Pleurocapsa sp. PCC 7327]AFY76299.1 putative ATPase (AAA+ superfamily) [Pleurocapsa sp. PCC 7327]